MSLLLSQPGKEVAEEEAEVVVKEVANEVGSGFLSEFLVGRILGHIQQIGRDVLAKLIYVTCTRSPWLIISVVRRTLTVLVFHSRTQCVIN